MTSRKKLCNAHINCGADRTFGEGPAQDRPREGEEQPPAEAGGVLTAVQGPLGLQGGAEGPLEDDSNANTRREAK